MAWQKLCPLEEIPALGARVVAHADGDIAVFRAEGDSVFAIADACPHKGGPLSQGIVHGQKVTCPLHNWNIELDSGHVCAPDEGCVRNYPVRIEAGEVWLET
ncbi:MAG: nitrite reductase (NAD(P)H) small subunit [Azoarcus sp.]|nr:MAG: nitrite reductase (NAD(P)H) small subunit [Azoarcus sp.]TVT56211.1 MAG: nitrite reductase small subunit NirD [Azoarcus sp. PHD]